MAAAAGEERLSAPSLNQNNAAVILQYVNNVHIFLLEPKATPAGAFALLQGVEIGRDIAGFGGADTHLGHRRLRVDAMRVTNP
jgi:hypothetical protein